MKDGGQEGDISSLVFVLFARWLRAARFVDDGVDNRKGNSLIHRNPRGVGQIIWMMAS